MNRKYPNEKQEKQKANITHRKNRTESKLNNKLNILNLQKQNFITFTSITNSQKLILTAMILINLDSEQQF